MIEMSLLEPTDPSDVSSPLPPTHPIRQHHHNHHHAPDSSTPPPILYAIYSRLYNRCSDMAPASIRYRDLSYDMIHVVLNGTETYVWISATHPYMGIMNASCRQYNLPSIVNSICNQSHWNDYIHTMDPALYLVAQYHIDEVIADVWFQLCAYPTHFPALVRRSDTVPSPTQSLPPLPLPVTDSSPSLPAPTPTSSASPTVAPPTSPAAPLNRPKASVVSSSPLASRPHLNSDATAFTIPLSPPI